MALVDARDLTRPDPGGDPALGERRAQVLGALREAEAPLSVGTVADRVGLHPNTARFHLDALVDAGLADRGPEDREQPGRPRVLYSARPENVHAGRRSYRLLAEILSSYLAATTPHPAEAARDAGQAWGHYLADRPPPFRRLDTATAVRQLVSVLDEIGFAPEPEGEERISLRHCPFREIAEQHGEVVCSIHLGLMRGLLAELGAPVDATRLDPFVEPDRCVTHLTPRT
jgi:predicted ArsR family transcriptional regulator